MKKTYRYVVADQTIRELHDGVEVRVHQNWPADAPLALKLFAQFFPFSIVIVIVLFSLLVILLPFILLFGLVGFILIEPFARWFGFTNPIRVSFNSK